MSQLYCLYSAYIKGGTHTFSWILTVTGGRDGRAPVFVAFNKTTALKLEVTNTHTHTHAGQVKSKSKTNKPEQNALHNIIHI